MDKRDFKFLSHSISYSADLPEMKVGGHWTKGYNYSITIIKKIESFQGSDELILNYIELYLKRYPHLSTYKSLTEFKKYIDEKNYPRQSMEY